MFDFNNQICHVFYIILSHTKLSGTKEQAEQSLAQTVELELKLGFISFKICCFKMINQLSGPTLLIPSSGNLSVNVQKLRWNI